MPSTDPITKESVIGQRSAHLQKPWEQHPPLFYRYRDDEKIYIYRINIYFVATFATTGKKNKHFV